MTPSDKPTDVELLAELRIRRRIARAGGADLIKFSPSELDEVIAALAAATARAERLERDLEDMSENYGNAEGELKMSEEALSTSEASRLSVEGERDAYREYFEADRAVRLVGRLNSTEEQDNRLANAIAALEHMRSQDPGPHPCGEQPGADVAATAALADYETLAFQVECIRRSIEADVRYALNGADPATSSRDLHIIPRMWLPLGAAVNWIATLRAAEDATRATPAITFDGGEAVHEQVRQPIRDDLKTLPLTGEGGE